MASLTTAMDMDDLAINAASTALVKRSLSSEALVPKANGGNNPNSDQESDGVPR